MTRKHIDSLLLTYQTDLAAYSARHAGPEVAVHGMAMVTVMLSMDDPIKLNRWFGFLQGVMYVLGLRTVDELRDETRGPVHEEFTGA